MSHPPHCPRAALEGLALLQDCADLYLQKQPEIGPAGGEENGNLTHGHLENHILTTAICETLFLGNFIILS